MGMGKTVTSLALIANSSVEGPTLVVVPVTLVPQWRSEATRMLPEARVVVYHGSRRVRDPAALAAATIVITTYEVAASDNTLWRRRHTGATPFVPPLAQVRWARIIADEAHRLRETYTARFAALQMIPARSRWCLTGTPVTLTVDDLYGLLVFLRYDHLFTPVSYRCGTAALWRDLTRRGTGVLREVLARTMWRFTDRAATIQCAIEHHHVPMDLAQAEADAYRAHLPERVRSLPVLTLLQTVGELRRLCNGETPDATRAAGPFCERLPRAATMAPPEDPCPICYEPCRIAVSVGRCRHAICSECCENIFSHPGAANRCPLCRLPMNRGPCRSCTRRPGRRRRPRRRNPPRPRCRPSCAASPPTSARSSPPPTTARYWSLRTGTPGRS